MTKNDSADPKDAFSKACDKVLKGQSEPAGIGTLNEKTLHSVLKNYIEPDKTFQEVKTGAYIADIFRDGKVTEIQTRNFYGMKKKLAYFLEKYPVTVVYPIPAEKYINWIDPDTGEILERRRSPKKPRPQEIAHELIHILPFIDHENLTLRLMYIDVEDYKLKNGWDETKKKGASRYERIPKRLSFEKYIRCPDDYRYFIPEGIGDTFTVKDFRKKAKVTDKCARRMIYILVRLGLLEKAGKEGRADIYSISPETSVPPLSHPE